MTDAEGVQRLRSLFQPDILLPAQYLDGIQSKSNMTPEKRLMLAVLTDALCCFQKYYFRSYNYGKTVFEEAESWIMDDDAIWPFSYRSICDHLGIHPDYLRCRLFRWRGNQLASHAVARRNPLRKRVTRLRA